MAEGIVGINDGVDETNDEGISAGCEKGLLVPVYEGFDVGCEIGFSDDIPTGINDEI